MPGSMREVKNAEEEGVEFVWLAAPEAFLGDGAVSGVHAVRMHLGLPDPSGRQSVEPIERSNFTLPADLAIKALGFDPEDLPGMFGEPALEVTRWGTLKVNQRTFETSLPGVFAAGDIVRGASLVVWAIRDGRDAAARSPASGAASQPRRRRGMRRFLEHRPALAGEVGARSETGEGGASGTTLTRVGPGFLWHKSKTQG